MRNHLIKVAMAEHDIRQWELARIMGIHEVTLSRRLRDELPIEEQKKIVAQIKDYAGQSGGVNRGRNH